MALSYRIFDFSSEADSAQATSQHFNQHRTALEPYRNAIIDFLFTHLDAYGDARPAIAACLDYATSSAPGKGGLVVLAFDSTDSEIATANDNPPPNDLQDSQLVGATIVNHTGMHTYIPEHILVYIAVHQDHRGRGIGKALIKHVVDTVSGDVALHVEKDNPAIGLYEHMGFAIQYLEMRLLR